MSGWTRYFQVLGIDEEEAEHAVVRAARDFVLKAGVSAEQILRERQAPSKADPRFPCSYRASL